jgi:HTH-type transcriptional regulator/antitoxin HigA
VYFRDPTEVSRIRKGKPVLLNLLARINNMMLLMQRYTMDIHPIRNEKDYDMALAETEQLWGAIEGTKDGDKLDILLILIEDYENKYHQISPPDPVAAIKFRMEQMNLTRKDLESIIGGRGRVSEVLNHRRGLSLSMIRNLHTNLSIPLESLIGET